MMECHIIFLSDKYFDTVSSCFCLKKRREMIVEELENKGLTVKSKSSIKRFKEDNPESSFDDESIPKLNVLYMRLSGGDYYSDELYAKRKMSIEREILFLLAAKLGVSTIEYTTEITETTLSKTEASVNAHNINSGATYSKSVSVSQGQSGKEVYLNRGAPVYCLSKTLGQVEENIKRKFNKLNCKLFSYQFYKSNPKLMSFVYKRFNFKMGEVEYTSEMSNNMDVALDVKTTLMDYGIGIKLEKHVSTTEKITYKLTFFNDQELRLQLNNIVRLKDDPFETIRELYDSENNKDIAVYHITEYVRKYSKKCTISYTNADGELVKDTYKKRLFKWIEDNGMEKFATVCHSFTSSYQIKTWLRSTLKYDTDPDINEEDDGSDIESYGILKLQKRNYRKYRENLRNPDNESLREDMGDEDDYGSDTFNSEDDKYAFACHREVGVSVMNESDDDAYADDCIDDDEYADEY